MAKRDSKSAKIRSESPSVEEIKIPVVEEEAIISKRVREAGRVRVKKSVHHHTETVQVPVTSEHVEVRHVAIDQPVDKVPAVRQEGDVTIIPVTEEVVVVTKQLVLKEEIHLVRTAETENQEQAVELASEEVVITRLTEDDDSTE